MEINIEIDEFKRNLKEILFELQRKRILLGECRQELNESILKQQDLERQLMTEKHKNSNDEYQNIILKNAVETLEEERQKNSKELIKLKVQLELSVAERDSLRDQARSQCLEINNLKRQTDDLSCKHKCHISFQKDISDQLNKVKLLINQVNELMNPLRRKQEDLEKSLQINCNSSKLLSVQQFEKLKIIAENERNDLENKLIIKSAEYLKLQQLLENSFVFCETHRNTKTLNYWKETCNDLEVQLKIEKEGSEKLVDALKLAQDNDEYLRKKLIQHEEKISELEKKLQKYNNVKTDIETQTETDVTETTDLVKSEQ